MIDPESDSCRCNRNAFCPAHMFPLDYQGSVEGMKVDLSQDL